MKSGQAAMEFLMTYGLEIFVILVVFGALFLLGVFKSPEKFNPELHNCVKWEVDTSNCALSSPLFSGLSIETGNTLSGEKVRLVVCHYGFVPDKQGEDYTTAQQEFEDKCVSWQPKIPQLNKEEQQIVMETYCHTTPSDSEKCECIKNETLTKINVSSINKFGCNYLSIGVTICIEANLTSFSTVLIDELEAKIIPVPYLYYDTKVICVEAVPKVIVGG